MILKKLACDAPTDSALSWTDESQAILSQFFSTGRRTNQLQNLDVLFTCCTVLARRHIVRTADASLLTPVGAYPRPRSRRVGTTGCSTVSPPGSAALCRLHYSIRTPDLRFFVLVCSSVILPFFGDARARVLSETDCASEPCKSYEVGPLFRS